MNAQVVVSTMVGVLVGLTVALFACRFYLRSRASRFPLAAHLEQRPAQGSRRLATAATAVVAVSLVSLGSLAGAQEPDWQLNGNDIYYDFGNVGIGTATPQRNLDVVGDIRLSHHLRVEQVPGAEDRPAWVQGTFGYGSYFMQEPGYPLNSGEAVLTVDTYEQGDAAHFMRGNVGIGTASPEATLQVNGTMRVLGDWAARECGPVYQAPSDGFVVAFTTRMSATIGVYTDANNPPTTLRGRDRAGTITIPVRKGDYWRVAAYTSCTPAEHVQWIPLGN